MKTFKKIVTILSVPQCECGLPAVDHFQQPETSSQQLLSEVDDKMQAENLITEAKIEFSKDAGLVWRWAWSVYDPSQKWKHR